MSILVVFESIKRIRFLFFSKLREVLFWFGISFVNRRRIGGRFRKELGKRVWGCLIVIGFLDRAFFLMFLEYIVMYLLD